MFGVIPGQQVKANMHFCFKAGELYLPVHEKVAVAL